MGLLVLSAAPRVGESAADEAEVARFEETVQPFIEKTCLPCHNDRRKRGGLSMVSLQAFDSVARDPNTWEKMLGKMRTGEMPPAEDPRPHPETLAKVTAWIDHELERVDRLAPPEPGRLTIRRLNRTEYNNTVRDLLGVDVRPADDFPQDDAGYGFDNIADVLSISPVLMERYVIAAERVARLAVFGPEPTKPTLVRKNSGPRKVVEITTVPDEYDETGLTLPNAAHTMHRFPVDGDYIIRVHAGGIRPAGSEPVTFTLWIDGREVASQTLDAAAQASFSADEQELFGKTLDFRTRVTAGEHWVAVAIPRLFEGLPPSYGGPNPSTRPAPPPREFTPPRRNLPPERIAEIRKRFEEEQRRVRPSNSARVGHLEIGGPYDQATGPLPGTRERIFICGHPAGSHVQGCARRIITNLARRAYRRPVADVDVEPLLELFQQARRAGDSFDQGIAVALQAILVSPDFLFRMELDRAPGGGVAPLSPHELATRLSYFLWASMPDDELMAKADAGTLGDPAVLEAEVRRMLRDERAMSLVREFGGQWLQIRALENINPDVEKYPDFDPYLRMSMREETERFFARIMREDRSILEFLDARYSYVNERLARHYGIPGVRGPEFQLVRLTDPNRGGIVTHASVLTVSSYSTRTSPVLRGRWVLDNLLDAPPPAPPPDTPPIDETGANASMSMRQQLEAHRKNPICAACHVRMDPLGFGLENFDPIGRWRERDGEFPIDATGNLPDGRTFQGPAGLREILSTEEEAFAKALTSKLLTYALGRGLEPYDRRTVRMIARRLPHHEYRFSGLVLEIVNSVPFRMRRGVTTP
ncbi:MAG TPA: DUF1592 domain-containing protein [Vicinamibacterales bacterium]